MSAQKRQPFSEYMLNMARFVASRSTCLHRKQGAILVIDKRVISTGFNGSPPGQPHCNSIGWCAKEKELPCRANGLHGEANAVLTAARLGVSTKGSALYSVYSPCEACCNILKVAGIVEVWYTEVYDGFPYGPKYLETLGIKAICSGKQEA